MLIGAATVVAVLVATLAMPVGVRFDVSWHGELEQRVDLIWAFGLVRLRISPPDTPRSEPRRAPRKPRKKPRARPRTRRAHVFAALRSRSFRRRLLQFVASLWRAVRKERIRLDVRLGLGDPADTGRLWALVGPISGLLRRVPDVAVSLEPDFHDATFELDSSGTLRIVPLRIVLIVAALLVSPAFWHGMRTVRGGA